MSTHVRRFLVLLFACAGRLSGPALPATAAESGRSTADQLPRLRYTLGDRHRSNYDKGNGRRPEKPGVEEGKACPGSRPMTVARPN